MESSPRNVHGLARAALPDAGLHKVGGRDEAHCTCKHPTVPNVQASHRPNASATTCSPRDPMPAETHLTGAPLALSTTIESTTTSEKAVLRDPPKKHTIDRGR